MALAITGARESIKVKLFYITAYCSMYYNRNAAYTISDKITFISGPASNQEEMLN